MKLIEWLKNAEQRQTLKSTLYHIIFGTETRFGKLFDIVLIYAILLSVLAVMLDTVESLSSNYPQIFFTLEWFFTIVFTIEYLLRLYCSPNRLKYVFSFYGIVDLVSIIPSYLALFITGAQYLLIIRLIRVLRIFRVLKLVKYLSDADTLVRSMMLARRKILIFFFSVLVLCTLFGCLMYVVEGGDHGFTSIPESIYWAIVTVTTVGYGDITPHTTIGQIISSLAMLMGYSIIAIPTGIITAELANEMQRKKVVSHCPNCGKSGHDMDAIHCKWCGANMESNQTLAHDVAD